MIKVNKIELGFVVRDTVSKMEGVVIGISQYAFDDGRFLVCPESKKGYHESDASWVDRIRIEVISVDPPDKFRKMLKAYRRLNKGSNHRFASLDSYFRPWSNKFNCNHTCTYTTSIKP